MLPKVKGEISEYATIAELMKLGYKVSKPMGDNCPYDIIVENKKGELLKIQIKSMNYKKTYGIAHLAKVRINSKHFIRSKYNKKDVDYFIIYCLELNKIYLIKNDGIKGQISLRYEKAKSGVEMTVNYAKDYELKNNSFL